MAQREPGASGEAPADATETPGSTKPEPVEDRPNVGIVEPEDYPQPAGAELPGGQDHSPQR